VIAIRPSRRAWWPVLAVTCVALLVAGIVGWVHRPAGPGNAGSAGNAGKTSLRLLACDDLADMEGLLTRFTQGTGLRVEVEYQPMDQLLRTAASPGFEGAFDAVWISVNGTQSLPEMIEGRLETGTIVMSSPLVLGLRAQAAARLGSRGSNLGWRDLVGSSGPPPFNFGMLTPSGAGSTNPDEGAALLGIAAGLAGTQDVLTAHEVAEIAPALRALHDRQTLSAPTSAELVRDFQDAGAAKVDAILTHEAQILRLNATKGTTSPLTVLAPGKQAVFTRYVLRPLLSPRSRTKREDLRRLTAYLLDRESQEWIAQRTYRRPATTDSATRDPKFASLQDVETPRVQGIVDRVVHVYRGEFHYPRIVFALDISGSMRGQGMDDMRRAFATLGPTIAAGSGTDVQILLIPFASVPARTQEIELNAADPDPGMASLAGSVDRLEPGGNTALYAAVEQADDEASARAGGGDLRTTSIIVITDGRNTGDTDLGAFERHRQILQQRWCARKDPGMCRVPVFPVLVGGADPAEMRRLAAATGGQVSDARTVNLGQVLRDLTGASLTR
jgi:Ca-activated chloride channel family protein